MPSRRRAGARARTSTLGLALAALTSSSFVAAQAASFAQGGPRTGPAAWSQAQGSAAREGSVPDGPAPPYARAWTTPAGTGNRGASGPVVAGDLALAVGVEEVIAVDALSGDLAWAIDRVRGPVSTPAVTEDGALLVYAEGSNARTAGLVGLRIADRAVAWRLHPDGVISSPPAVEGGTVYAGTEAGTLYALEAESGDTLWTHDAGGQIFAAPTVADRTVFVTGEDRDALRGTILALRATDGEEVWRYAPNGPNAFVSAITVADGRAFVGMGDGLVRALDAGNGAEVWTFRTRSQFSPLTIPAFADGDLFVVDGGGAVRRLDGDRGTGRWRFQYPSAFLTGSPLVIGDRVVVGLQDGRVVAIDVDSGLQVWEDEAGTGTIGSLAVAGDLLLAGVEDSRGGLVAFRHDPDGALTTIESPSALHLGPAVLNYLIAVAGLTALLWLAFRLAGRRAEAGRPGGAAAGGGFR